MEMLSYLSINGKAQPSMTVFPAPKVFNFRLYSLPFT